MKAAAAAVEQNQQQLMQQRLLEQAMRRFVHRQMYAAWNQWRSWAEEMRRQACTRGARVGVERRLGGSGAEHCVG